MHQLIRYKNLLFIAIIQLLIAKAVIAPTLAMFHVPEFTPEWLLLCMILSTMFIAAGGYVINDYFDLKIDRINRPEKVMIGVMIEKSGAMRLYQVLTGIGIVLGLFIAFYLRSMTLGFIYIVVPGMLWFYSASYKRQLIIGNLIVALAAALVPLMPLISESTLITNNYGALIQKTVILKTLYAWVCGFSGFAFIWTFIREIIKDMEDVTGDRELECHTIPVVYGLMWSKIIVTLLIVIACVILGFIVATCIQLPNDGSLTLRYFLFGIVTPSICLIAILWNKSCKAYKNASTLSKFIMLIGVFYSLIYYFIIARAYGLPFLEIFQVI